MAVKNYCTMNGQLIGEYEGTRSTDYILDGLGSVIATFRSTGTIQNQYRYSGYGQQVYRSGTGTDPYFLWVGGWGYRTRGMVYVRRRVFYEDAAVWTSVDLLWPDESAYGYCIGNPVSYIDASGAQGTIPQPTSPPKGWDDWDVGDSLPAPSGDSGDPNVSTALLIIKQIGKIGGVIGLTLLPSDCGGGQTLSPYEPTDISPTPVKNPLSDARCDALHVRYKRICNEKHRCQGQEKGETDENFCKRINESVNRGLQCTTLRRLYLRHCNPTPLGNDTPEQARCKAMKALCDSYGSVARCMKIGAKCMPHGDSLPRWPNLDVVKAQCRKWQQSCGRDFNWPPKKK